MRLLTFAAALLLTFAFAGPVQAGEGCPYAKSAAASGPDGHAAAAACAQACSQAENGDAASSCPCAHGKRSEEVTAEAKGDDAEPARVSTEGGALATGR